MTYKKTFLRLVTVVCLSCLVCTNLFAQNSKNRCEGKQDTLLHKFVYSWADEAPEPEGGLDKLVALLGRIRLPQDSSFYAGRVIVAFVVEPNGSIDGKRITKDSSIKQFIGKQVLDIVSKIKWKPAKCKNRLVPCLYALPVTIN